MATRRANGRVTEMEQRTANATTFRAAGTGDESVPDTHVATGGATAERADAAVVDAEDAAELHAVTQAMGEAIAAFEEAVARDPALRALRDRVQTTMAVREQVARTFSRRYRLGATDRVGADGVIVRGT